jgi:hypothetical protein
MAGRRLWTIAAASAAMLLFSGTALAGAHHHEGPPGHTLVFVRPLTLTIPDTAAPMLAVLRPHDGATVSKPTVTIRGIAERGSTVALGDAAIELDRFGRWRTSVALAKGLNVFTFSATDAAGNVSTATEHITFVPVVLVVRGPHDGAKVFWPTAFYRGWAQPGVTVRVNDAVVPTTSKGFWKVKLALADGLNTFTFTATDTAGNVTTVVRHVTLAPKPAFEHFAPWEHWHGGWSHEAAFGWSDHHWGWGSSEH